MSDHAPAEENPADDASAFDSLIGDAAIAATDAGFATAFRGYDKEEVDAAIAGLNARVRAGLCHDTYSAHQGVEHDDVNVLVLGSRVVGTELARELMRAFLAARFSGEERHVRRLDKVKALESQQMRDG